MWTGCFREPSWSRRHSFRAPAKLTANLATWCHRQRVLTPRETEVFKLIARGLSNTEIAETLDLAEQTVKTHVGRILAKLGLRDRAQVVVIACETHLVAPGD